MSKYSVNKIFKKAYPYFEKTLPLPDFKRDAAHSLMVCRTAVLGGHVQACPDGHFFRVWYNSCKHRMCPQCAYLKVEEWLQKQKARILNCEHYHVIFTIPQELRFLLIMNFKLLAGVLFTCSRDTIFELTLDPKRIGAKPGIIASLHTWTKTLAVHPHIHCLITGGGLGDNGVWRSVIGSYLFPFEAARDLFRGKVNAALKKALQQNRLILPSDMSSQQFINLLNKLGRKKWNVKVCEKYEHGNGILTYLARYLRGGPISNTRIKNVTDTHVTFNIGREKAEYMKLSLHDFINRFLRHVPLPNTVLVRSYGLYSHMKKAQLNEARRLLGQPPVALPDRPLWQDLLEKYDQSKTICPVCKKLLIIVETILPTKTAPRMNSPPAIPEKICV